MIFINRAGIMCNNYFLSNSFYSLRCSEGAFGFNHFPYSILNYENKLLDMKNYSCSWPISYDVIVFIRYFQG